MQSWTSLSFLTRVQTWAANHFWSCIEHLGIGYLSFAYSYSPHSQHKWNLWTCKLNGVNMVTSENFCNSSSHLFLSCEGFWGTTDDFTTSFLHFSCSPLPSWTWRTPGLSIPWCCLPTSSSACLVFFPPSLCLARWFLPDLMNVRHDHTTAVCVSLWWSGLHVVRLPAGSWHSLPFGNMVFVWDAYYIGVAPNFHGLYSSLEDATPKQRCHSDATQQTELQDPQSNLWTMGPHTTDR